MKKICCLKTKLEVYFDTNILNFYFCETGRYFTSEEAEIIKNKLETLTNRKLCVV